MELIQSGKILCFLNQYLFLNSLYNTTIWLAIHVFYVDTAGAFVIVFLRQKMIEVQLDWCCQMSYSRNGLFQKKKQQEGGGVDPPCNFSFFYFIPEIPDKTKLLPWKFHKIVLDLLEIPRPKTKTPGNSTLFFLGHLC